MDLISEAKQKVSYLIQRFPDDLEPDSFKIKENSVDVIFPGGHDEYPSSFKISEFNKAVEESKNIEHLDNGKFKTSNGIYQLISGFSIDFSCQSYKLKHEIKDFQAECILVKGSLVVGIAALMIKAYNSYFTNALSGYTALVINYDDILKRDERIEQTLLESLIFELSSKFETIFYQDEFDNRQDENIHDFEGFEDFEEELEFNEEHELSIRPLEIFDHGKKLFLAAIQVENIDLRFFSFFKVLEYYSPIALRIEAHNALLKKLTSNKVLKPDGDYINSIFNLVNSYNLRKNDRDLIKTVFLKCIDLIDLQELLPVKYQMKGLNYDSNKTEIEKYSRDLADILVNTRNKMVHAKSNYNSSGNECPEELMEQFTHFIQEASLRTIRWFERLASHQKIREFD